MIGMLDIRTMDERPAWQRRGAWLVGAVLYGGSFRVLLATHGLWARLGALAGIGKGLVILTYTSRALFNERMRAVDRRHVRMTLPAFLVYIVTTLYVWPLADHTSTPWLKQVSVLPASQ